MKRIVSIVVGFMLICILTYTVSPRAKFYAHFGIWLPSYCDDYHFTDNPDFRSLLGMDGLGASANFEIDQSNIGHLIESIHPEKLWLKYSEVDTNSNDLTLDYPAPLPKELLNGEVKTMLWSQDTKGDYYNIWLIPSKNRKVRVSITMPFT